MTNLPPNSYETFHMARERWYLRGLYDLVDYLGYYFDTTKADMAEIGSFTGQSTTIFSQYFNKVHAIDAWEDYDEIDIKMSLVEEIFDDFAGKQSNIIKNKGFSIDKAKEFKDKTLDFVYIDAAHDYDSVIEDIDAWLPKLKSSGWIGGHDFWFDGPNKAVPEKFGLENVVTFTDGSWLVKVNQPPEECTIENYISGLLDGSNPNNKNGYLPAKFYIRSPPNGIESWRKGLE